MLTAPKQELAKIENFRKLREEALHEEELEKIVVSANELTVHSVEKNCNNIVFVAIRMVI